MTVRFSRRETLLRTAAIAAASVIPGAPFPGIAAPLRARSDSGEIDAVLKARVTAGEVPGVVAMAATENSVIYQGAFGVRRLDAAARMSTDTVFRIASMVKLLTSVAALQLVERGKLRLDEPAARIDPTLGSPHGSRRLRCARRPATARRAKAHHAAQPADAYIRVQLSALGRECRSLHQGCAQRSSPAAHAADVRSGHQMGLWRQSRPGQPAGGNRKWRNHRSLFPRSHPRPAQHERHDLLDHGATACTRGKPACPPGRRHTCSEASGETDGSKSIFRRRRHLFHGAGLPDLASGAAEWRNACRRKHPTAARRSR